MRPVFIAIILTFATLVALPGALPQAIAQQTVPNPLRPRADDAKPTEDRPATTRRSRTTQDKDAEKPEAAKPRRERSAKQRQQDDMMRACGSEWRAEKAALQAKGGTWRSFLKDCRAKKRTEQPV